MLTAPANAPPWAAAFARSVDDAITNNIWPYISRAPLSVAQLTPALAAKFPFGKAFVSDPPSNQYEAISNGAQFFYLDGTAV